MASSTTPQCPRTFSTRKPSFQPPHRLSSSANFFPSDFSGKRPTRIVSKLHSNRPNPRSSSSSSSFPSLDAEHALNLSLSTSPSAFQTLLLDFHPKLRGSRDYSFLLRELGNRGDSSKVLHCYSFALPLLRPLDMAKLATSAISVLGRLGKLQLAKSVFDDGLRDGFGNTVYAYSAMISAYGRSGCFSDALSLFDLMKTRGLRPNLVLYNTVIDACAKGGVGIDKALAVFIEMADFGVVPDRITYNSLLAVCSRGGLWRLARELSLEMVGRGIAQDVFTYNTLLDAVCKGGQLGLAGEIMGEMKAKNVVPNVVTYSTVVDGYAKAGRWDEALRLFDRMRADGVELDRVSYNTKISIYAKLGRFEDALGVCREMESVGIRKDVVTYNALLDGFGKQGKYDYVKLVRDRMKFERVLPNLLTYSTMMDAFSKGGLYQEAMEVFEEFKKAGLKADVVLYSALIDAFCKNGLVESAVFWLNEMTREGIKPNVVTYNTIIDALGRSAADEGVLVSARGVSGRELTNGGHKSNSIIQVFGQLAAAKSAFVDSHDKNRQEIMCILGIFHKMHEFDIKPNVVTFSAILNACSRCNSFEDASMLLKELRLFDDRVYGVAHGLVTGYREIVWLQALSLFDEVQKMDSSTASAFYNALTDVLWHFDQKLGAQQVVLEGKTRNVWENVWAPSCLDLHLMSSGAARAMVHTWLLDIRSNIFKGQRMPDLLSILTGWGKHSKVLGDSTLRKAVEALLNGMNSPFRVAKSNLGRFVSPGTLVASWLMDSDTLKLLILKDDRVHPRSHMQLLPA